MNIKEYDLSEIDIASSNISIPSLEYAATMSKLYRAEFDRDAAKVDAQVWKAVAVAFGAVATLLTFGLLVIV